MWQYNYTNVNELYHHGIKGQKWGVRRYQNNDGTWTPEGKIRYGSASTVSKSDAKKIYKNMKTITSLSSSNKSKRNSRDKLSKIEGYQKAIDELTAYSQKERDADEAMTKVELDYYQNKDLYTKYQTMAAEQEYKKDPSRQVSLDDFIDMYVNDDLDQQGNGLRLYLEDNKDIKKKYVSAQKAMNDTWKQRIDKQEEIGRDILGEYYDKPLRKAQSGRVVSLGENFMYEVLAETEKRWR